MPPRGGERDRDRQPGRKRPGAAGPIRKRGCYFCKEKVDEIDYKNAIKRAREMALLPYVSDSR
jgi:ribosomal protein S18